MKSYGSSNIKIRMQRRIKYALMSQTAVFLQARRPEVIRCLIYPFMQATAWRAEASKKLVKTLKFVMYIQRVMQKQVVL